MKMRTAATTSEMPPGIMSRSIPACMIHGREEFFSLDVFAMGRALLFVKYYLHQSDINLYTAINNTRCPAARYGQESGEQLI